MAEPVLDIIITHHNEPWSVGKPFFDMLENQQCFDFGKIAVTVVQDGKDGAFRGWHELLSDYRYKVKVVTIDHAGMAAARNAGLDYTSAPWVMFCDFDDMFADVNSLNMITAVLPTDDYDMLWGTYCQEAKLDNKHTYINKVDNGGFSYTHMKLYRRAFLAMNSIRFDGSVPCHVHFLFNSLVMSHAPAFRIGKITTEFFPYFVAMRQDSMTRSMTWQQEMLDTIPDRNVRLTDVLHERGLRHGYASQVVKTITDSYYRIAELRDANMHSVLAPWVCEFYRQHKDVYDSVSAAEKEVILDTSETEAMAYIQNIYNAYGREYVFLNERTPYEQWLKKIPLRPEVHVPSSDVADTGKPEQPAPEAEPHVAVFCGTANTYVNMLASAKSLLHTTPMDRVYFLTEDDTFPYDLPDIVENINIKDHPLLELFRTDGPNYQNSWTYMCLTRAIFPKLFPQYRRILSLDIDVVVQEDISPLWDRDMSQEYIAGVVEPQRVSEGYGSAYINFGVVMMNLEKLRNDGMDDRIIEALNRTKFGCQEQDAFNRLCAGHIGVLDNGYNATVFSHITGEATRERILHYAGLKYWKHFSPVRMYADMTWDEVLHRE